jgi:hypothetical protein
MDKHWVFIRAYMYFMISNAPSYHNHSLQRSKTMSDANKSTEVQSLEMERAVSISDVSEMKLYIESCRGFKKSYSHDDIGMMKARASVDASHLQSFLSQFNVETESAILHSMSMGLLKYEHILGIEDLMLEGDASLAMKRRSHVATILKAQNILRQNSTISCEIAASKLARVAYKSSSKCAEEARLRARLSLEADQPSPFKLAPATTRSCLGSGKAKILAANAA